ncbi:WYL domain-containing protein [Cytophagaceae bacterium ABcell3]|nr:WYL domain-containing protein [Cytophagaceae bacterium ABcell3]
MPINKDALVRYRIINKCLTNKMRKYPSKEELCEACMDALGCKVSFRTIDKDIEDMRHNEELGYFAPIAYDRVKKGYYYSEQDFSIDKIPLNEEEVNALQFAVAVLDQLKSIPLMGQFSGAVGKIVEAFNLNRISDSETFDFVEFDNPPYLSGGHLLNKIVEAIKAKQLIEFSYKKHGEQVLKSYKLEPYLLKEFRNRWYVIGKDTNHDKVKVFGLDRIVELEMLTAYYESDKGFDRDKYFRHAFGITSMQDDPVELLLSFTPKAADYIKTLPLHHSQKVVKESEDECLIQLYVFPTYELMMQLLSYGENVKVVEPESVKQQMIAMLQNALANY